MRKTLPPKIRDAAILSAITAVFIAIVRPAIVAAQGTVNSPLCIQNVRSLGTAIVGYAQDYDEIIPPLNSPTQLAKVLQPYTATSVAYLTTCPLTSLPYNLNKGIAGKALTSLPDEGGSTIFSEDSTPHFDGKSTIGYLSGTITYGGVATTVPADPNTQCISNAKRIGLAVLEYTQDYDETLPVYHNLSDLQTAVLPYARSTSIYTCPVTTQTYVVNRSLSGKSFVTLTSPATTKFLQDAMPHPNGVITTGYLDGHISQPGQ